MLDLAKVKTYPIAQRKNLVTLADFVQPADSPVVWQDKDFEQLCRLVFDASRAGRTIVFQMGAHVVKCGMGLLLRDLMERGLITHLAMNGACAIHDFEIALIGATSEDVPDGIEHGSFGMAEETGRFINETVNASTEGFGKASLHRRLLELAGG